MNTTRRQFLKSTVGSAAVISMGTRAPHFLLNAAEQAPNSRETILVVVQLSGGNDGLNTLVPYADDQYRRNRPGLAIGEDQVLKIDDYAGLHPALRGLSDLLQTDRLAIVQGVGYPNPNRSHFESMDIWHTCFRKNRQRPDGWIGRYLDAALAQSGQDVPALHLGGEQQPLALTAQNVRVPSVKSLERFRLQGGDDQQFHKAIQDLVNADRTSSELLDFLQTSTSAAITASRRVETAAEDYRTDEQYPETDLGKKLRTVAQLIDAELNTRIYYVELAGFDTHSQQADAHTGLLRQLNDAVSAFVNDITKHGHGDRVLVFSFSEFGRRVKENASKGTDHGAAAPVFLAGGRVSAGLIGDHPSLTDLENGDLKHHTDFRQVYATILTDWLEWPSAPILGGEFKTLPLVAGRG